MLYLLPHIAPGDSPSEKQKNNKLHQFSNLLRIKEQTWSGHARILKIKRRHFIQNIQNDEIQIGTQKNKQSPYR